MNKSVGSKITLASKIESVGNVAHTEEKLVSFCNGISTFVDYLMPNPPVQNSSGTI